MLAVAAIGGFLAAVNNSMISVALPAVSRHFDADATGASWTLLSYLVVTTMLVLPFGRVADMAGRRTTFVVGIALLSLGGLLAGLAPSIGWLVSFRCVQGVGGALLLCNVTALVTDAFPASRLSLALGINATVGAVAQVIGPALGGVLAATLGWRAVFWFVVPLGALTLALALSTLRVTLGTSRAGERFDLPGAVLSGLALGGLVIALSQGGAQSWTSPAVLGGTAAFVVFGPLFVLVEAKRGSPLVDIGLLQDRGRAVGYLSLLLQSMSYYAVVALMALYLQAAHGLGPDVTGVRLMYVALATATAAVLAGWLTVRMDVRAMTALGAGLSGVGMAGLAVTIGPDLSEAWMMVCLLAIGAGAGLFMTPNTTAIMSSVASGRRGVANGMRQTTQNAGYTLSTAVGLAVATNGLTSMERRSAYAGTLTDLSSASVEAFTTGSRWAFLVLGVAGLLAAVISALRGGPTEERVEGSI